MRFRFVPFACLALAALGASTAQGEGYRLDERFELGAAGSFYLRSEAGEVAVRGGAGSAAVVTITADREDFPETFAVSFDDRQPGRLEVVIERRQRGVSGWFGGPRGHARIEVELPRGTAAELRGAGGSLEVSGLDGAVRASSSGGALRASDLGGDAELESSGGRLVAEGVQGDLEAESSGGGVEVSRIGGRARLRSSGGSVDAEEIGGDLDVSSSGGGVRIREAHGEVLAESSGGPVRVGFAAGNGRGGAIGSSGGGVEVRLDPAVALELDAVASGGGVTCELPVTVRGTIRRGTLQGQLNGGGPLLKLRTSGGGITIAGE